MSRDTIVLVTGGSRGIGRAIVEALAMSGRDVAFTWRAQAEAAEAVVAASKGRAVAYPLDLLDRKAPEALVRRIEEELGPVGALVNNAGVRRDGLAAWTSDETWDEVLETNLGGAFRCCRAVLPGMVSRREGAIVNVGSISAVHGVAGQAAYAASKAGLIGMTRALAREVGRRGVRANVVIPGLVATDLIADLPPESLTALRATECLPGGTSTDAVASAVLFLLSVGASAITGQTLVVDAGASS